ncbi:uncharacterized protein C24H6.02c [Rosa rugosa]|uniref:uncharacterized protein C24H6.02c n=1 Tax=Rosa rugosa TaxID=74645 RepID=UPI002B405FD1|nr:uncharacterized protein C24H6.02c [Rosa rugosa]
MAARMLQKRIGSLLFRDHRSLTQAIKEQSVPSVYSIFSRFQLGKRDIQTETKPANLTNEDPKLENHEADILKPSCDSDDQPSHSSAGKVVEIKMHAEYNLKTSPRHDLCMVFTCTVCNTRTMKTASREAYEKGVVVARCNGCDNLHLFADHLGMFGEKCTVEDFLAARGEEVKKGTTDSLNLTIEDLAGKDFAEKKVENA